ncbi:MAG: hypothetical protein JL50_05235 [Peptococcaceae bacterium BICA1-7]|nr:MAG: hypothetical protein JL50_05235 [Peptococcaceae bacterium BICA1-7]HBV96019.1 N-acetyltransferase [Desulfotomaculum sp.]
MSITKIIRLVSEDDSASILDIYAPYITDTSITFECEVPTVQEFANRVRNISEIYPWIVCQADGCLAGYAYASRHHERSAYQWSVNLSVYIKNEYQRKGLARVLYTTLFELLGHLGYFSGLACITYPNPKSEGFHSNFGFKQVGVYHKIGYKLGQWQDVIWYQMPIREPSQDPPDPLPIKDADSAAVNAILQKNTALISW